jgi:hypothetical protein
MTVATGLRIKPHLNNEKNEERTHHDDTRHRGVFVSEQLRQARVVEGGKGDRNKLIWLAKPLSAA